MIEEHCILGSVRFSGVLQNSCIRSKLRDFLYVTENLPTEYCRKLPRIQLLKRRVQILYSIITRFCYRSAAKPAAFGVRSRKHAPEFLPKMFLDVHKLRAHPAPERLRQILLSYHHPFCYRDLEFSTNDCEALETGNISPRYAEDRLKHLIEDA
ncbi:hypothetical protein cypCar_00032947 [Cyprinus carpio]|nr:hypothetical protein cypCar_00032947 [Cyprinus carpio]